MHRSSATLAAMRYRWLPLPVLALAASLVTTSAWRLARGSAHADIGPAVATVAVPAKANPAADARVRVGDLVWITPGRFEMGSPAEDLDGQPDERQHPVLVTRGFFVGRHEVTQAEYESVMGTNPSFFKGTNLPVECVSWDDATNYCARRTVQDLERGLIPASHEYRLPTEAEWEYTCRAGGGKAGLAGRPFTSREANFDGTYPYRGGAIGPNLERTTPVESYPPNAWGVYDMQGNVWEWCGDWHEPYDGAPAEDPQGGVRGLQRINRGGSWGDVGFLCRPTYRGKGRPGTKLRNLGFRVVLASHRSRPSEGRTGH